ncbi:MAG: methylmalonyl-CoA epimerase [Syntrophobacterales bacterium]|nr:methylmalonyl-CoA epimerase [Syntrophobacterales bacterium]
MKILCVDHIGIATSNMDKSANFYTQILGLELAGTEEVTEQKVRTAFLPVGESEIEILESTVPDGPIARHISKNGEGIQHIALRVDDIEAALKELKDKGVGLIDETPRRGAGGTKIAFIHPRAAGGVLLELCQRD